MLPSHNNKMRGGRPNGREEKEKEKSKHLYAEPKFMIPPDALKLPEPFRGALRKDDGPRRE